MLHSVEVDLGSGRVLTLESGKMAKQANGAVIIRSGESVVLVTACTAPEPKPNANFFPLTVDYREYTYSAGRFPGGFIKREGRPTEKEILTSRLIDRPIRPLFPEGYSHETQVIGMVLSADPVRDPSTLAIVGAGASLAISDIPFQHVLAAVRVGMVNGALVANPTYEETKASRVNIVVAGTDEGIVMVESGAQQVSEADVLAAIEFGHDCCQQIASSVQVELKDAMNTEKYEKLESYSRIDAAKKKAIEALPEEQQPEGKKLFDALKERIFRDEMLKAKRRPDGRKFDQVRKIECEVGVLPRTHGSSLFTRGETQALVTATLGTKDDEQRIELLDASESSKRFMLHYNFPPFSVGEVGFMRGAGRREIGHGALAERALSGVLPSEESWPYAMRVVSDILESNGSSSMATVCGASLSLMDAGVPLKAPVAGVAMGLVKEGEQYAILTDIAGAEDHYGDMDFKVAGTKDGITALQMDIKVAGITSQIMREALAQAKRGRLHILGKMDEVITEGRVKVSAYAPRIYTLQIPVDKIRDVIGPGGKMIRSIIEQTGVKIDVEDTGKINVASNDEASANKALQIIRDLTATAEVGKTYLGKVTRLADFGAFVEILPGTDGLLHISEVAEHRIADVRDELKEGDQVLVKVLAVEGNRIRLSRKAILKEQRAKMGGGEAPPAVAGIAPAGNGEPALTGSLVIEGGGDFPDEPDAEPNFNSEGG